MDSKEYNSLIKNKDVLDYTTLNVTVKELAAKKEVELAEKLRMILREKKIEKPSLHSKTFETTTNYYKVDLLSENIEKIVTLLFDVEASFVNANGDATPTSSFYAYLVDKWNRLIVTE